MRPMNQKGKLTEPGLPKVKPVRTGPVDARSQINAKHGTRPVQIQGFGKARHPK
jgi:hypothetical protein